MSITPKIKKYFWDINPKKAKPKSHPEYFIERILELGDTKAFEWLKRVYGLKKIKNVSKKVKLTPKSKNYWNIFFTN